MPYRNLKYAFESWEVDPDRGELRRDGLPVAIGARSFEIIKVLVKTAGQLVTKDELMNRVWPGAVVEENTLHVHISAIRRAFGEDRGLLRNVSGRGYRLEGGWLVREESFDQKSVNSEPPAPQPTESNLPLGKLDLFGRAVALRDLKNLITAYRLVTLTGPGGIGKTAMALEVGRQFLPDYAGGIKLVEFASLTDPVFVASSIATVLNLKLGAQRVTPLAVAQAIGNRRLLLLLDNCEHVVDAAATLVETIIRVCPNVSILATSREVLRIEGEYTYRVQPLDIPDAHLQSGQEQIKHSAVQLFIARVQSQRSTFVPREKDVNAISSMCRRLDGIPLAIEFAAARAATLGISETLSSLSDLFGSLIGRRRTAIARHQTLRATLDWSYELLPPGEQHLLRFLSIFAGGFTLGAATAVLGENDSDFVAHGIASLVSKSLITPYESGGNTRWRLLETIRSYAFEKLTKQGDQENAARRHAAVFRDLVAHRPTALSQGSSFAAYGTEIDNVRAALDWAFSPGGDVTIGAVLAASYAPVWFYLSSMGECGQQVERALSMLEDDSDQTARLRMQLYIALGLVLAYTAAMEDKTQSMLMQALEIAERLDDVESQLLTIWSLWNLRLKNGNHRKGQELAEKFFKVSHRSGDPADILVGERLLGTSLHFRGRQPDGRRHFETVLSRYRVPTSERHSNWYLYDLRMVTKAMMARGLVLQGFIEQAEACAQESLAISQDLKSNLSICFALRYAVCAVAIIVSDVPKAEQSVKLLADSALQYNLIPFTKLARYLDGMLMIKRGEYAIGTQVLLAALEVNIRDGWSLCYPEALSVLAEGYLGLENYAEALSTLQRAFDWSEQMGERWCDPELYRIKAILLLQAGGIPNLEEVEGNFSRAVAIARYQGALFWELKAALGFARLRVKQGRMAEARELLSPVYDRFVEGFDAVDLRLAKEIIDLCSVAQP